MIWDLFSFILVFCQLSDLLRLCEKFKEYLTKDFKTQLESQGDVDVEHLAEIVYNKFISVIEKCVKIQRLAYQKAWLTSAKQITTVLK